MRRVLPRTLCAALLGLSAVLATAPSAGAADGPTPPAAAPAPSPAPLTPDEVATLRRRFPDWDAMDPATRERIAASVVRLRGLSAEERARVLDRVRRLDRAGPVASETFARHLGQWSRFGPDDRRRFLQADLASQALAAALLETLSGERRAALEAAAATDPAPWARHALGTAVGKAWRQRALAPLVQAPALDHEPSAAASAPKAEAIRDLRERVRGQGGAAAPEDLRQRYAWLVLEDRVAAVRSAVAGATARAPDRERLLAFGRALRDLDVAAFDGVAADLGQAAAAGAEGLDRFRERFQPGRAAQRERGLWDLVRQLESRRRDLPPHLVAPSDALQAGLLRALGAPEPKVAALEAEPHPGRRLALLLDLLRAAGVPAGPGGGRGPGHPRNR